MNQDKFKYILFLGGSGFLGLNVLNFFISNTDLTNSYEYKFIVVGSSENHHFSNSSIVYRKLNFLNNVDLKSLFREFEFQEVFHFVSTTVPATSNSNIHKDISDNLLGTIGLLDIMVEFGVKKITYLSSGGTVYGESKSTCYQEDELSSPNNSYGVLKLTIENYIRLYSKLFGIKYLILRVSNPFGQFHKSNVNGLINIAIRKSLNNETISVWGDGNNSKDYIYARDLAKIFWDLNKKNISGEVLNLGSGVSYSINQILTYIKSLIDKTNWVYTEERNFDTKKIDLQVDKLNNILPIGNTDFKTAIEETYIWELNSFNNKIWKL